MKKTIVLGTGGHAKVVIDLLLADPAIDVIGCTGTGKNELNSVPLLGDDSILPKLVLQGVSHAFVAVGNNRVRARLAKTVRDLGLELVNAVSPFAYISPSAALGSGIAVMPGAVINAGTRIGDLSIINTGASVDHDGNIGEACHIAPGSSLAGNVTVGSYSFLGTGVKVIDGIRIGNHCMIGAGAAVIRDIPDGVTAVGVPARIIKQEKRS
ncbi:acetyltransferase [Paenibacillus tarimensis]